MQTAPINYIYAMRYLLPTLALLIVSLTGCAMPPRLHSYAEVEKDSTQVQKISKRDISTDTLAPKPRVTHTEITFSIGQGDSALLMNNSEFCYNETSSEIWLQNPDAQEKYSAIPLDSIRVCQKQRKGSGRSYFVRNRALFWPVVVGGATAALLLPVSGIVWITSSATSALLTEAVGTAIGTAAGLAPAVYFSNTDGGAVRPDYDYCDTYYNREDLTPWLHENRCTE